jgi:hypothetical protein
MLRLAKPLPGAAALLLVTVVASRGDDFAAAASKSADRFKTTAGQQYGVAFMRSTGTTLVPAAQACLSGYYPIGATYDVVFIVSASGRIERVLHGSTSGYGQCVASHIANLHSAAKPPSAPWPIHIRFLHGHADPKAPGPLFMVIADDAETPR